MVVWMSLKYVGLRKSSHGEMPTNECADHKEYSGEYRVCSSSCTGFDTLKEQIEDELAGMEAWAEQEDDYVDFDPADYVENSVDLARMKAQVKQIALARHMKVTQSFISKLEQADQG